MAFSIPASAVRSLEDLGLIVLKPGMLETFIPKQINSHEY